MKHLNDEFAKFNESYVVDFENRGSSIHTTMASLIVWCHATINVTHEITWRRAHIA